MSRELKLPALGEDVEEGDVLKVLVEVGDRIEKDQPILEIETDKATLEVPAEASGTVEKLEVSSGDRVRVGQTLLVLGDEGSAEEQEEKEEQEEEGKAGEKKETREETEEAEREEAAEAEAEVEEEEEEEEEEEKTTTEETAEEEEAPPREEPRKERPSEPEPSRSPTKRPVPAAPTVRRLARELGVPIDRVEGTGPGGRIGSEDVKEYARTMLSGTAAQGARAELPDLEKWGEVERKRLSGLRRAASRRLATAWTQIPHVTQHDEADVTELETFRKQYGGRVESMGGKLTVTAIAIHVVAAALRKFPQFNASLDLEREEVVYKKYRHIGVAVDTDRGLLVPVIRNADRMGIAEIAVSLNAIAERARDGKLAREDMEGGSFTVTNLGGIGGTSFTPIVSWPEVAILGLSRASTKPVWGDEGFEPRLVLPLSLSYDHRLIDGADAARFLRFVAEALEHPLLLSLSQEGDG